MSTEELAQINAIEAVIANWYKSGRRKQVPSDQ